MNLVFKWEPDINDFFNAMFARVRNAGWYELVRGGWKINADAKMMAPVNTGLLRSTITVESDYANMVVKIGTHLRYGAPVEFGSRPHTPPFAPIQDWAEKKKLPAGAIWQNIRLRGTRAHPYLRPAYDKNITEIINRVASAMAKGVKG